MTDTKQSQTPQSQRSPDFKYIPCDTINLSVSEDGIKLILGVDEVKGPATELVGVHMSLKTAMALKSILSKGLDHYQEETGNLLQEPDLGTDTLTDIS
ncbi:hypothetical protein [Tritonibacter mobilis]|uniref:hypothetical protein n=1 Tax=Tritonibacter mobilis TaxID=379347 RepID=UPI000806D5E8|nr:hypothetical protein [Tritonibacter mobilis]|tara:strand:+ start:198 stop:491 length:294 start_codon:yes stop_codon:yes gene_type:complete